MITNLLVGLFLYFIYVVPRLIIIIIIIGLTLLITAKGIKPSCKILIIVNILLVIFIIFVNIYHEKSDNLYKKMNRINNDKSLIGLAKEEVEELLGKPEGNINKEKVYTYNAGYVTREVYFLKQTFWFKTYYYELKVYFDEADKVKSTLMQEAVRLGG